MTEPVYGVVFQEHLARIDNWMPMIAGASPEITSIDALWQTTRDTPFYVPREAVEFWARYYNVPIEYAMCIAKRESTFDPYAQGDFHMPSPSRGMFQMQDGTREYAKRKAGVGPSGWEDSPFEQARLALYLMGVEGRWDWWHTFSLCIECREEINSGKDD